MANTKITRLETGVEGFDKIVEGGLPSKSISLVTGTPGTAKTIFAMQFLANGAMKGEKGVMITLEESTDSLIRQFARFGYDLESLIKSGKLKIIEIDAGDLNSGDPYSKITHSQFIRQLEEFKPKRIALDSINLITELSSPEGGYRRAVGEIADIFKKLDATTLIIHERKAGELDRIEYSIEEFICDGIIHMQLHLTEYVLQRFLTVIKMRETNQSTGIYPFKIIDKKGIQIMDLRGLIGKR
jgi:circadian clock protein KaiC